ncbi:acetyl-CoA carboxylase biotin carboxyl carrier protein [Variovorax rhizosphaerae]|uniref:Biotin/lipoyl-containing protein n=1 Tax=Variovorax rhizosphaerae TaxID=1836200 RepID=A0ABU8WET1_9BURK
MPRTEQLQQLIQWLAGTDIGLLDLRTPEGSIRLERNGASEEILELDTDEDAAPPNDATPVAASSLGIFLHTHPMQATALTNVGDQVSAGQPLGLLQIGPLLQSVDAPLAGVITQLHVDSGRPVGYGEPLLDLQPLE